MSVMSNRTKAILMNCVFLFTLLGLLHFYPAYVVAVSGAIVFSVGNLVLIVNARRNRRKSGLRNDD